ncbi:dihydrofolate reductase family protein [Comamonas sp. JC664]|uniref:dihydrofolate reductase family protein n=1 Tax=Comamonas sp. JC664 TaxID=2801917 RepID=UPI00174C36CC|nr:dihydrofolate reductase family protein [Comamonas sp. JC664]MBL0697586.1 dihydrofolate reductase [Comamonas sp. JC664]GHG68517.1 dihydrofolate reductase [Comamonas sp. KCTC 72670]
MRKLKYHVATSVDGFIAHEDDTYGAFMQKRLIEDSEHVMDFVASLATYTTALMGRRTYEVGLKEGVTDPYAKMDTYVFSRTMKASPNPRVKLVSDDATGEVRRLKAQEGGDIYLSGGGAFAGLLFAEGLIDELLLKVNPLILGAGIPLVSSLRTVVDLELKSTKVYSNGVLLLRYAVMPKQA